MHMHMQKCQFCENPKYVEVTQLHGIKLSFEKGIESTGHSKPVVLCEKHFNERIWNKR